MAAIDHPHTRNDDARPLTVWIEDEAGSENYVKDPRCRVAELKLGCDDDVSSAKVNVFLGEIPDGRGIDPEAAISPSDVFDAEVRVGFGTFLSADQRIAIRRDDEAGDPHTMFCGYCDEPQYSEEVSGAQASKAFSLLVEGVLKRHSDTEYAQVYGRWMRTAAGQDALDVAQVRSETEPFGDAGDVGFVESLACVFNPDRKGNRAAAPVTIAVGDRDVLVHVFTHDGDPDGEQWTWAQVLRYLMMFHFFSTRTGDSLDELAGELSDGNTIDLTDPVIELTTSDRPSAPVAVGDAWAYAMLGRPGSFVCEGCSLAEAFVMLADATGTHFRVDSVDDGELIKNRCYWWARGCGTQKDLYRLGVISSEPIDVVLANNNTNRYTVRPDASDIIVNPIVRGDVMKWEITAELVPGWMPDRNLHERAEDDGDELSSIGDLLSFATIHQELDEENVKLDSWYDQYHKRGCHFHGHEVDNVLHSHRDVLRKWVLRETGSYRAADYARAEGPFTADLYAPWKPSSCNIAIEYVDDDGTTKTRDVADGEWSRIGRPLEDCLSADADRRSLGVVVEFSWDGGATWEKIPAGSVKLLDSEAGIYLDAEDLTKVFRQNDEEGVSLWEAYLNGVLRVRVTAVIAGDARLEPNLDASLFGVPLADCTSRLFDVAKRFKWASRSLANSQFRPNGASPAVSETSKCVDDLAEIQRYGESLLEVLSRRQIPASMTVPWITQDYSVGDSIASILGTGIEFWTIGPGGVQRFPDVVSLVFTRAETRVVTDDRRLLDVVRLT